MFLNTKVPNHQAMDWPVCGLLRTQSHSRRWANSYQASSVFTDPAHCSKSEVARIHRRIIQKTPDNHNDVITHLEPDILEFKVKWALGSITMSKASGGDGIWAISNPKRWWGKSVALNMPANMENSAVRGHRTGKGQFSFQSLRKAMPMNCSN